MHLPGRYHPKAAEDQGQENLQRFDFGHIHGHADAQEDLDPAQKIPVDVSGPFPGPAHGVFTGQHGGSPAQELCVLAPGGIHHPALPEKGLEGAHLKEAALVAHLHPFVEQDSAAIHLDQDVAQLGPAQHHGGQVRSQKIELAGHLTGGHSGRGHHGLFLPAGEGSQENKPVKKGQTGENPHGNELRVAGADIGTDPGEHIRFGVQGHAHGLVVVKTVFGGAGDHGTVDHQIQLRCQTVLPVGTVEIGGGFYLRGQGDGIVHGAHRIGEAAENGKGHHKTLPVLRHGDNLGQIVGQLDHKIAGLPAGELCQVDQNIVSGPGGAGGAAVDGNAGGTAGQGEIQSFLCRFQMKGHLHGDHAVAINIDGTGVVQPGGRAGCRNRHTEAGRGDAHHQRQHSETSLQWRVLLLFRFDHPRKGRRASFP